MSQPLLRRQQDLSPVRTGDGADVFELFGQKCPGIGSISLATGSLKPGQNAQIHYHVRTEEIYYVVSGQGVVKVADHEYTVEAGDAMYIPATYPHGLVNTSETDALVVLCISSPPFDPNDFHLV